MAPVSWFWAILALIARKCLVILREKHGGDAPIPFRDDPNLDAVNVVFGQDAVAVTNGSHVAVPILRVNSAKVARTMAVDDLGDFDSGFNFA